MALLPSGSIPKASSIVCCHSQAAVHSQDFPFLALSHEAHNQDVLKAQTSHPADHECYVQAIQPKMAEPHTKPAREVQSDMYKGSKNSVTID